MSGPGLEIKTLKGRGTKSELAGLLGTILKSPHIRYRRGRTTECGYELSFPRGIGVGLRRGYSYNNYQL